MHTACRASRGHARTALTILLVLSAACLAQTSPPPRDSGLPAPVRVEFFHEPGCPVCRRVNSEILPELTAVFGDMVTLYKRDTTVEDDYLRLVHYQRSLGVTRNDSAILVVDGQHILGGWDELRDRTVPLVEQVIAARMSGEAPLPSPAPAPPADGRKVLAERVRGFTLLGVAIGGLSDGINPCAISTLVFFLSLLSVLKVRGRRLAMVGVTFCAASFLTYFALGLGLLHVLQESRHLPVLQTGIRVGMILVLLVFAYLSLRDAVRFRRSGDAKDVTLQLPERVKSLIHRVLHRGLEGRSLFMGSLAAGAAVTALESVCTGQVYVPTLVLVMRSGGDSRWHALGYLTLYNLLFVTPLVAAFILTYRGLKTQSLLRWSRRNVVISKILLGVFFIGMAILIALV